MNRFLLIPSLLLCLPSLKAQNNGIEQSSELTTAPTGETIFRWDGKAGRSYFIQISDATNHLVIWNWAPVIESGNDEEISYEVDATADKGFFRLKYTDQPLDSGKTVDTSDFDKDGISNIDEITSYPQTDPLNADTDNDGLPDGWEVTHGFDPTDNGSINFNNGPNDDPDNDGFDNLAEFLGGTDPGDPDSHPPGTPLPGGVPLLVGEQTSIINYRWGFPGFQTPSKHYKKRISHIVSTDPDNDGDGGDRTDTDSYDDLQSGVLTHASSGTGGSDYGTTWTISSDTARNRDGTDDDGSGETSTTSETLSDEYTIPAFVANVESWIPEYHGHFTTDATTASIALTPEATDPEPATEYSITKLKYKWQVNPAAGQVVSWLEVFTPADGSSPIAEAKSWTTGSTETESPVYEIDPTTRNGKKNGVYSLLPVDLDIEYASQDGIKELEETKEDTGDGGYISLKSQTHQGEDITPTTYLVIRATAGLPADRKVRLRFNAGGRFKVSKNLLGTDLVVSEVTEFPVGQETRLYLVGETKSQSRGGETITMQIDNNGSWIDGDSLKATVVQTQFQIDLRIFIPYNWVNIPHPAHVSQVARGDTRTYDPQLNGTYRVAQWAILNLYKEWVPEVQNRMVDDGKSAGTSEHYSDSDVLNWDDGAKHSEDTVVKPSYIKAGAPVINSGTADLSNVDSYIASSGPTGSSDDTKCYMKFDGAAAEPIIAGAATIDWRIYVGISKNDPLNPQFVMQGVHDGFPAYEIYINSKHPVFTHTNVLQWRPDPAVGVLELLGFPDVTVGPQTGLINQ